MFRDVLLAGIGGIAWPAELREKAIPVVRSDPKRAALTGRERRRSQASGVDLLADPER